MSTEPTIAVFPTKRLALCGACGVPPFVLVPEPLHSIRPCEGHHSVAPPAATGLYDGDPAALPKWRSGPFTPLSAQWPTTLDPAPTTLDPATHARQALDLVIAWAHLNVDGSVQIADEWICQQAVDTVAMIHALIAAKKRS